VLFTWHDESGDTVIPNGRLSPGYQQYIEHAKTWSYCLTHCELNPLYWNIKPWKGSDGSKCQIAAHVERLWSNRYGGALAFEYWPVVRVTKQVYQSERTDEDVLPGFGSVVLLPPTDLTEEQTVALVLRDILKVPTHLPEPAWVTEVAAPGQAPIDTAIEEIKVQFETLVSEYDAKLAERASVRKPLLLLYDEGHSLEDAVRNVLRFLGAEVEDPPEDDANHEDGWITVRVGDGEPHEGVLEIKSTSSKQFNESGLKQLAEWQTRGQLLREKTYKRVFIGNASRDLPLAERPDPFPDGWMKAAALQEACAIRTEDLFKAYELDQSGQLDRAHFWASFFATAGIFDIRPFLPQKPEP
jgi:hypothetical protein